MNRSSDREIFNPMAQASDLLSFAALVVFIGALLVVLA